MLNKILSWLYFYLLLKKKFYSKNWDFFYSLMILCWSSTKYFLLCLPFFRVEYGVQFVSLSLDIVQFCQSKICVNLCITKMFYRERWLFYKLSNINLTRGKIYLKNCASLESRFFFNNFDDIHSFHNRLELYF